MEELMLLLTITLAIVVSTAIGCLAQRAIFTGMLALMHANLHSTPARKNGES